MAKLKNIASEDTKADVISQASEVAKTEMVAKEVAIPEYVEKVLKMYPNYAELAVDLQGGVYTKEQQHLSKGKAILYQNPYYKQ